MNMKNFISDESILNGFEYFSDMKSNIFKFSIFIFAYSLLVFTSCEKDKETEIEEELVVFEFPRISYVDSLIYLEMQKTCKDKWDLSLMDEETFVILSYKDEYAIHCVGQLDNQYYWFVIRTDLKGKWINDGRSPFLGRGSIFNLKSIDKLKLEDIKGFWDENSAFENSGSRDTIFESHPGYLSSESKLDKNGHAVLVSFFKTKSDAVEAMENKRNNVAAVINQGNSTSLPGIWWYTASDPNAVFVSRWNVILEVDIYDSNFKAVENTLYDTANEVLRRMSLVLD